MKNILPICALVLALAACGPGVSNAVDPRLTPVTSFPTTVEGTLEWSVVEGDSEEIGGTGEIYFGHIESAGSVYPVEISDRVMNQIGVPEGPVTVRATLGAKSKYAPDGYVVTLLERR